MRKPVCILFGLFFLRLANAADPAALNTTLGVAEATKSEYEKVKAALGHQPRQRADQFEPAIYRCNYDLTGDGVPELLLSSSLRSDYNMVWDVYTIRGGLYTKTATAIRGGPRGLYRRHEQGPVELISYTRLDPQESIYNLAVYRFMGNGTALVGHVTLSNAQREEARNHARRKNLGMNHPVDLPIEEVGVESLLRDRENATWRPYDRESSPGTARPRSTGSHTTDIREKQAGAGHAIPSKPDYSKRRDNISVNKGGGVIENSTQMGTRSVGGWLLLAILLVGGTYVVFRIYRRLEH